MLLEAYNLSLFWGLEASALFLHKVLEYLGKGPGILILTTMEVGVGAEPIVAGDLLEVSALIFRYQETGAEMEWARSGFIAKECGTWI